MLLSGVIQMSKFNPKGYLHILASELGLSAKDVGSIMILYEEILFHDSFKANRSRRGLLLDSIYIYCNANAKPVTVKTLKELSKKHFGVATQPRPSRLGGTLHQLQSYSKPSRRT